MGDICDMVAYSFDIGDEIDENAAALRLALTFVKPLYMRVYKTFSVAVYHVFHFVDVRQLVLVVFGTIRKCG